MKTYVKILIILFVLLLSACILVACTPSGTAKGLEYTLVDNSYYEVAGIGTCKSQKIDIPAKYNGLPVKGIVSYAFSGCSSLTSITIPDSITSIDKSAFSGCSSLTSITIPDSITSIGDYAFSGCSSLTSITIPDSITSIGNKAFLGCNCLIYNTYDNAIYLGNEQNPYVVLISATSTSITSCEIHPQTKVIFYPAFSHCSKLTSITIPDSVIGFGSCAFYCCESLTSITIPDGVTKIGDQVFEGCSSLKRITIPDSVTSIGKQTFNSCSSLKRITIPDSVTYIGESAFDFCDNLAYNTYDNAIYLGNEQNPYLVLVHAMSESTSCEIHPQTKVIAGYAFYECKKLTNVTIPDSVTSIGNDAFRYCSSLTTITFTGTQDQWNAITGFNQAPPNATVVCTGTEATE